MAVAAAKSTVKGYGNSIVDDSNDGNDCTEGSSVGSNSSRAMYAVTEEAMGMAAAFVVVMAITLTSNNNLCSSGCGNGESGGKCKHDSNGNSYRNSDGNGDGDSNGDSACDGDGISNGDGNGNGI